MAIWIKDPLFVLLTPIAGSNMGTSHIKRGKMFEKHIENEVKSLEEITKKTDLMDFYNKCRRYLTNGCNYSTQFEHEEKEGRDYDLLLAYLRDYALFDEDNSKELKIIGKNYKGKEDVFNCCSRTRWS